MGIKQIESYRHPVKRYVFKYTSDLKRKHLAFSSRVALKKAARKHCLDEFNLEIDCGDHYGEVLGRRVSVDTLGKFVFGMTRFRAAILTVPFMDQFDIYFYTDDEDAIALVLASAEHIGLRDGQEVWSKEGDNDADTDQERAQD